MKNLLNEEDFSDLLISNTGDKASITNSSEKSKPNNGFNIKSFESKMIKILKEKEEASKNYERTYISITELTDCLRKCYFFRKKIIVENKWFYPYLDIINENGNFIHSYIQKIYNFEESEKTIISKKYNVKGRVDGINEKALLEIKTIDPEEFKLNPLKKEFYAQAMIGAYILNTDYQYSLECINIICVNRNLKQIKSFVFEINNNFAKYMLSRALILSNCLNKNIIPNKTEDIKKCEFCNYKKHCH